MANNTPTPYRVVIFHKDKQNYHPIELQFVKSIFYTHNYCKKIGYDYHYMNIYNRKTGKYLGRQYFDKYVIDKPPY
ncbi:hypothetical protein [Flavobacterium daejeonense]|uniref:hypothetical protein n=1 Tax=Flavobacterium daejeonense TaxID=350893 RepID=UPI00047D830C|nr:hypothetical protein [Flavobacterium daejeonense]